MGSAGMDVLMRKKYTPEFRAEAARLVVDTGRPIAHVARELGLGEQLLGRWVHRERARSEGPGVEDQSLGPSWLTGWIGSGPRCSDLR